MAKRKHGTYSSIKTIRALHQLHLICLPLSFTQGKPLVLLAESVDKLAEQLLVRRVSWQMSTGELTQEVNALRRCIRQLYYRWCKG